MGISENFHSYILLFFLSQSVHARIELFSLYVLFSHFSPFDATQGTVSFNFFGVHVHTHA